MTLIFERPRYKNGDLKPAALRMVRHRLLFRRKHGGALNALHPWFDRHTAELNRAKAARDWCAVEPCLYVALVQGNAVIDWRGNCMDFADLDGYADGFSMRAVEGLIRGGGAT